MSVSELNALSFEELEARAGELEIDVEGKSNLEMIELISKAEEEGQQEEARNPSIPYEKFKEIYAKVYQEGGTMADCVKAVDEAGYGLRKTGEIASKLKGYRDRGIMMPKLAGAKRSEKLNVREENDFWTNLVKK